jgi:epsilon-lactone hydrolase
VAGLLSPEIRQVVEVLRGRRRDHGDRSDLSLAERRASMDGLAKLFPFPADVEREQLDAGGVPAAWLIPPNAEPGRALLYLHGGGYSIGSLESHGELASRIARGARARALFAEYRLAPEHPFPAALEDALAVWRWLASRPDVERETLTICGDSAGGGLALATTLELARGGEPLPAAVAALSPWTDMSCSGPAWSDDELAERDPVLDRGLRTSAAEYRDGVAAADPRVSPLHGELAALPRTLLMAGTEELLFDDARRFAAAAAAAGAEVELDVGAGLIHVWPIFATAPEAIAAAERVGRFLRAAADAAAGG